MINEVNMSRREIDLSKMISETSINELKGYL